MTNDYLTTRQVQDLLKVDRITVYRMLNDGRIRGVKIGQQWRFAATEVERLLGGTPSELNPAPGSKPFPTHCIQAVQNLYVELSGMGGVVLDVEGEPLTECGTACAVCRHLLANPAGRVACQASWKEAARNGTSNRLTCHAGFEYLRVAIREDSELAGWFLAGQLCTNPSALNAAHLAAKFGLQEGILTGAAMDLQPALESDFERLTVGANSTAATMQAILVERSGLMQRLESIARITRFE